MLRTALIALAVIAAAVGLTLTLRPKLTPAPTVPKPPAHREASRRAEVPFEYVQWIAFTPNGKKLFAAAGDGSIALILPESGELANAHRPKIEDLAAPLVEARRKRMPLRSAMAAVLAAASVGPPSLPLAVLNPPGASQAWSTSRDMWSTIAPVQGLEGNVHGVIQVVQPRVSFLHPNREEAVTRIVVQHNMDKSSRSSGSMTVGDITVALDRVEFSPSGAVTLAAGKDAPLGVYRSRDALFHLGPKVTLAGSAKAGWVTLNDDVAVGRNVDRETVFWDLKNGAVLHRHGLIEPSAGVLTGRHLVTAHADGLRVWDAVKGAVTLHIEGPQHVAVLAASADGTRALTVEAGGLTLWDLGGGTRLDTLAGGAAKLALAADGKRAAALEGKTVRIWDLEQPNGG